MCEASRKRRLAYLVSSKLVYPIGHTNDVLCFVVWLASWPPLRMVLASAHVCKYVALPSYWSRLLSFVSVASMARKKLSRTAHILDQLVAHVCSHDMFWSDWQT